MSTFYTFGIYHKAQSWHLSEASSIHVLTGTQTVRASPCDSSKAGCVGLPRSIPWRPVAPTTRHTLWIRGSRHHNSSWPAMHKDDEVQRANFARTQQNFSARWLIPPDVRPHHKISGLYIRPQQLFFISPHLLSLSTQHILTHNCV